MNSKAVLFLTLISGALCNAAERPLMRDFIGLNVHTVQFKPALYAPVTKVLRNYHPLKWDVGEDTSAALDFPFAKNRVNWESLYGGWQKAGYKTHASILFDDIAPDKWKSAEADARKYGEAFAKHFGAYLDAAEIGNEPGKYDDALYRKLFESMARGLRAGKPGLRIATCAANLGKSGRYSKSMDLFAGLEGLWDIINIHTYAEAEPWPTWRRSYPEDPATKWIENIGHVVKWRDEHAKGKEVWVTEFGYDASTKPPPPTGDFSKWVSSTEEQQAMWTVRSFLLLPRLGVDRAHLYFFNDSDEAKLHGSSGITRNFEPKPVFHALAWLQSSLGDYRFSRVDREVSPGDCYCYEFTDARDPEKRIFAAWLPTGEEKTVRLFTDDAKVSRAERMPLKAGAAEPVEIKHEIEGYIALPVGEKPTLIWLDGAKR
jgi:hypothetical protein